MCSALHRSFSIGDECELSSSDAITIRNLPRLRKSPEVHSSPAIPHRAKSRRADRESANLLHPAIRDVRFAQTTRKRPDITLVGGTLCTKLRTRAKLAREMQSPARVHRRRLASSSMREEFLSLPNIAAHFRIFAFVSLVICDTFALDVSSIFQAKFRFALVRFVLNRPQIIPRSTPMPRGWCAVTNILRDHGG